jgi:hypothetical protein
VGRVWPRHGHRGRPLNSVLGIKVAYSVVLYRYPDGRREPFHFEMSSEMSRLGTFPRIQPILDRIFPGRRWNRDAALRGWESDEPNEPSIYVALAPDDPSQVLCFHIRNAEYHDILVLSTELDLLVWNPENERFVDPKTWAYLDA